MSDKKFDKPNDVHVQAAVTHRNPVVVEVGNGRKDKNLDVRHWYWNDEAGAYCRTKQGVQFPLSDTPALLTAILDAFNQSVPDDQKLTLA